LLFYNFNRRHGSLRKELKVRTPFDAVQSWFHDKPEIFKILPNMFQDIAFEMVQHSKTKQLRKLKIKPQSRILY
jgi:hypothetical protein